MLLTAQNVQDVLSVLWISLWRLALPTLLHYEEYFASFFQKLTASLPVLLFFQDTRNNSHHNNKLFHHQLPIYDSSLYQENTGHVLPLKEHLENFSNNFQASQTSYYLNGSLAHLKSKYPVSAAILYKAQLFSFVRLKDFLSFHQTAQAPIL